MKKAKVHRFWITSTSSVGTSDYKLFVTKADYDRALTDYDRALKRIKELEANIK